MSTKPVSEEERAAILDSVKLMMRILSNFNHGRGVDSGAQHGYDEDVSGMVTDTSLSADTGTPTRVTGSIRSAREVQQEVTQPQVRFQRVMTCGEVPLVAFCRGLGRMGSIRLCLQHRTVMYPILVR